MLPVLCGRCGSTFKQWATDVRAERTFPCKVCGHPTGERWQSAWGDVAERRQAAVDALLAGLTLQEVAESLGYSLTLVSVTAHQYGLVKVPQPKVEQDKLRSDAHWKTGYALKTGRLVRPEVCEDCGKKTKSIEAHHPDYRLPFFVRWLCRKCHARKHPNKSKPKKWVCA